MTPAGNESPYPGLLPYSPGDAERFFGRDAETRIAADNLRASRLTVLYGQSGVGKSSLLRAGVFPLLNGQLSATREFSVMLLQDWRTDPILQLRQGAGAAGGETLEAALQHKVADYGSELLLIFDQFEDFFQYGHPREGDASLLAQLPLLLASTGVEVHLLIGIREDALALLDSLKRRVPAIFDNVVPLNHLSREAALDAMRRPLDGTRWRLEPQVAAAVLDELQRTQPSGTQGIQSPYLQLVMRRWWSYARDHNLEELTRDSLVSGLGGPGRIIERHFDEAIEGLPPKARQDSARIFGPMITPTGRSMTQTVSEIAGASRMRPATARATLEELRKARLLVTAPTPMGMSPQDTAYEFAHDLLARRALDWRRREELRAARRRIIRYAVLAVVTTLAAVWAILRWNESVRAKVLVSATISHARDNLGRDPELSVLLAAYAADRTRGQDTNVSNAALDVLHQAIVTNPLEAVVQVPGSFLFGADWSPDGRTIAVGSNSSGNVSFIDAATYKVSGDPVRGVAVYQLRWRPQGDHVATITGDWNVRLINAGDRTQKILPTNTQTSTSNRADVSWCADGVHVVGSSGTRVVLWGPGTTTIWPDTEDAKQFAYAINAVDVTPDCKTVAIAAGGRITPLWSPDSQTTKQFVSHLPMVYNRTTNEQNGTVCLRWDPTGNTLASAGSDGVVTIENPNHKEQGTRYLGGHYGRVYSIDWSPDGSKIATGGVDGTARIWDTTTGSALSVLFSRQQRVLTVAWNRDGTKLLTTGEDNNVKIWAPWQFNGWVPIKLQGHSSPDGLEQQRRSGRGRTPPSALVRRPGRIDRQGRVATIFRYPKRWSWRGGM